LLIVATAGCVEVKEKPPRGEFHITLDSEEMFFVDDGGGTLHGPHAEVDSEIAHAHTDYEWEIEDLGHFEGSEPDLPPHDQGVRKASYNMHFIEEENHTGLLVTTVPDMSGIYLVIGDGTGLAYGDNSTHHPDFEMAIGPNLTQVQSDDHGAILEYGGPLSEPMEVTLSLNESTTETSTYVLGIHAKSGETVEEETASIRINPGEVHDVSYVDGVVSITIVDGEIVFEGEVEDLPSGYRTHIGQLEWEGHIGEPEESPGLGGLAALISMTMVAVFLVRSRRR
jgi:hypothetical protein